MKKSVIVLIVVIGVLALLGITVAGSYNGLVSGREEVNKHLGQIDNQLQRRSDLIPNLVATVKEYAGHEKEIFEQVAEARTKLAGATSVSEKSEAELGLNSALARLLAIAENYPDLKANTNFINLQDELAGTENRIATARKDYNDHAKLYNTKVQRFPTNIIAGMFGFEKVDYFQASEESKENPDVGELFGD